MGRHIRRAVRHIGKRHGEDENSVQQFHNSDWDIVMAFHGVSVDTLGKALLERDDGEVHLHHSRHSVGHIWAAVCIPSDIHSIRFTRNLNPGVICGDRPAQQLAEPDLLIECPLEVCFVSAAFRFKFGVTAKPAGGLARPLGPDSRWETPIWKLKGDTSDRDPP